MCFSFWCFVIFLFAAEFNDLYGQTVNLPKQPLKCLRSCWFWCSEKRTFGKSPTIKITTHSVHTQNVVRATGHTVLSVTDNAVWVYIHNITSFTHVSCEGGWGNAPQSSVSSSDRTFCWSGKINPDICFLYGGKKKCFSHLKKTALTWEAWKQRDKGLTNKVRIVLDHTCITHDSCVHLLAAFLWANGSNRMSIHDSKRVEESKAGNGCQTLRVDGDAEKWILLNFNIVKVIWFHTSR